MILFLLQALLLALSAVFIRAQSYSCPSAPSMKVPVVAASGFKFTPVVANLTTPRGIALDSLGNILVVERGRGISAHRVDKNGCVSASKLIISDSTLNHGIDVFGGKLYASSSDVAWVWDYNSKTLSTSNKRVLITGMDNPGAKTRTLSVSRKYPNYLIVSVGSSEDIDLPATASNAPGTKRASVKAFNLNSIPKNGVNYINGGKLLGSGLRNAVALAEDRGGVFHAADNGMDNSYRFVRGKNTSVSSNNPAENVFNLGNPVTSKGIFAGYPYCLTVWDPSAFTDKKFQPGDWFVQEPTAQFNDASCYTVATRPSAILTSHTAPLDMKFGVGADTNLYLGMHGAYNPDLREGYKVVAVAGSYSRSGEWSPKAPLSSRTAAVDVISNADSSTCSAGTGKCFHPVGLVWSQNGENLYVTSDTSGEIFMVKKTSK